MRWVGCAMALSAGILLASCRFIPTDQVSALSAAGGANGAAAHDPDEMVASMWTAKVVPYFEEKAGPFLAVRDLAAKAPDEAGAKWGYRAKSEDTPWTLMVRIEGTIVAADLESRAATIGVDASGTRQDRRDRADWPRHARHGDPRCARFRLVRRFHQPDRFRPIRQGVQHLRQPQHARKPAARGPDRAQDDA